MGGSVVDWDGMAGWVDNCRTSSTLEVIRYYTTAAIHCAVRVLYCVLTAALWDALCSAVLYLLPIYLLPTTLSSLAWISMPAWLMGEGGGEGRGELSCPGLTPVVQSLSFKTVVTVQSNAM